MTPLQVFVLVLFGKGAHMLQHTVDGLRTFISPEGGTVVHEGLDDGAHR